MEEPDLVISRLAMPITLPRSPALTTMAPLSLVSVFASDEPLSITRLTPLISASAEATDSSPVYARTMTASVLPDICPINVRTVSTGSAIVRLSVAA